MRKFVLSVLMVLDVLFAYSVANAKGTKEKYLKKEVQIESKRLKQKGWKILDDRNLNDALFNHFRHRGEEYYEVVGVCYDFVNEKVARKVALSNAIAYATSSYCCNFIPPKFGYIDPSLQGFYEEYERMLKKNVKDSLMESFGIVRTTEVDESGVEKKELMVYYLISFEAVMDARVRAFEHASRVFGLNEEEKNQIRETVPHINWGL